MRLRLDKLVLSAGLALAMVATTIPVGAAVNTETSATEEYTLNGKTAIATDVAKAVAGEEVTTATATTKDGIKYTSKVTGDITVVPTTNPTTSTTDDVLKAYLGDDLSLLEATSGGKITVTEVKTYALSDYKYSKVAATDTDLDTEKANALAAAKADLVTVAGGAEGSTISTNNTTPGGTYKVEVGTFTDNASYTNGDGDALSGTDAVGSILVNGVTLTVTTTYTITNLEALGMTYDVVYDDSKDADDNLVFSVIKYDGKTVSEVESTNVANGTVASITDLTATYYLVEKTVSVKSDLITKTTYTGSDYVVTISDDTAAIANITTDGKTAIDKYVSDNSATLINYLYINVAKGGNPLTYTSTPITFTIDVPVDVESGVTYKVLRFHDGNVEVLDTTVADGVITFSSDLFSDFALVTVAADTTEDPTQEEQQQEEQQESAATPDGSNGSGGSSSNGSSAKTADNSMMPLFMTTLLLALCAGSLAIYKEKKTN